MFSKKNLRPAYIFSLLTLLFSFSSYASDSCTDSTQKLINTSTNIFKFHKETREFKGLTHEGFAFLKEARNTLRARAKLFNHEFRKLSTLYHAGTVMRLFRGNMFLYGPPGGAKSAFVNWMMSGESEAGFKLQLHQMITEQAFTGGQNFEAAKEGRFEINTKGSLADYQVALIDEAEKGNPAALASLLSLLNEREVLVGNKVVKARLETLFATSNASLPELHQQFLENGQGSTTTAFLGRFQAKAFVYNWLSEDDQKLLDKRREQREYLKVLAEQDPSILNESIFEKPGILNWDKLRQIARVLFKRTPEFTSTYLNFINDMRKETHQAIKDSEKRNRANPYEEQFVYFPSADYTERIRQQIPDIIQMSTFVDFLLSPLADDPMLLMIVQNPIELGPLSIWRSYLSLTTVGPGTVRLTQNQDSPDDIDIDFDFSINPALSRDQRELSFIKNLQAEQVRFKESFLNAIKNSKKEIKNSNGTQILEGLNAFKNDSFELQMLHYGSKQ